MLRWNNTQELGHPEVDRDLRQIATMFNLLADAVDLGADNQAADLVDSLMNKARVHCESERRYLSRCWDAVSEAAWHHARLCLRLGEVRERLEEGDRAGALGLLPPLEHSLHSAIAAERMAVHLLLED